MARRRKVERSAAIVDESDKVLYSAFRNSANELSQLYSEATSHNRLSFEAGQRHALEKLSNWMAVKQQGGILVTTEDISAYLQNELNNNFNASYESHGGRNEIAGEDKGDRRCPWVAEYAVWMDGGLAGMMVATCFIVMYSFEGSNV